MWNRCEAPRGGGEGRFELLFCSFQLPTLLRGRPEDQIKAGRGYACAGGGKGRLLDGDGGGGGADAIDDHKPDRSKL